MTDGLPSPNLWPEKIQNQCFEPITLDPFNDLQIDAGCYVGQAGMNTVHFDGQMNISGYESQLKIGGSGCQMSKLSDQKIRDLAHKKISKTDYLQKKKFFSKILSIKDAHGNT